MKTIGEKAAEYLRKKNLTGIMTGDSILLHEIAEYCGIAHRSWKTERQILNAIDRSGFFNKGYTSNHGLRRCFELKVSIPYTKENVCVKYG